MTPVPWFRAEHRPARHKGAGPTVDLIRRGEPATGNPERDLWSDTGCVYGISVADAIALRDSLDVAITAAIPPTPRESADLAEAKRQSDQLTTMLASEPPPTDPAILTLHPGLKRAFGIVDAMIAQPLRPDAAVALSLVRDRIWARMHTGALTSAVQAPARAPRTCWTCGWARGMGCVNPRYHDEGGPCGWVDSNTDKDAMPLPTATPCPGWEPEP